jgi:hypothetical protein
MPLRATPQNVQTPQVEFQKNLFDDAVWSKGYKIEISKSYLCPCQGTDGNALTDCQNCMGTSYFYINPIETIGLITGINHDTQFKKWSIENIGTISLTVRDNLDNTQEKVSFYDKVTLLARGAEQAPVFGYHSEVREIKDNGSGGKFIFTTYKPIEIIDAFYFTASNTKLTRITDFNIKEENPYVVEFPTLPTISNGVIAIRYKNLISYHVLDIPHEVRYSTVKNKDGRTDTITLPTNAICRRDHLVQVERPDYDGTGILDNTYLTE